MLYPQNDNIVIRGGEGRRGRINLFTEKKKRCFEDFVYDFRMQVATPKPDLTADKFLKQKMMIIMIVMMKGKEIKKSLIDFNTK